VSGKQLLKALNSEHGMQAQASQICLAATFKKDGTRNTKTLPFKQWQHEAVRHSA
jgi:predicted pyridoxine 5'-phosphate oxidase superfamily flavin-nucleotide-binding protein